jgi:hypothetical protein
VTLDDDRYTARQPRQERLYGPRNDATRIDVFEELSHTALAALRSFCRRMGAPHLLDEVILPTLEDGDSSLYVAVRDRPWPPWGVGARHITAACQVQTVTEDSYAVSPVYVTSEDLTNVGLMAAVYKEVLEALAVSPRAEVNYLVADGASLAPSVLGSLGFTRAEDVFLTERARYYTWRLPVADLIRGLELDSVETPDLLAHDLPDAMLQRAALFFSMLYLGARPEWDAHNLVSEILRLVRGGHAGKPGGVPGGTGRWGWASDPPDWFFVTLENFLGERRAELLDYAVEHEQEFSKATVVDDGGVVVDERRRRARTLDRLGDLEGLFVERLKEVLAPALQRMKLEPFPLGRVEIQMTASGDGDYFRLHHDSDDTSTRELSFVYFLYREPRRFSGGELRIFDAEVIDGQRTPTDRSQILSPRQDVLVLFPSRNEHELLPVRVPSREFADSRFTVNGWIHRAGS